MRKFIVLLTALFVMFFTTACNSDRPGILFNKYPITEETVMGCGNVFKPNTRIYYLVILPEKIHSRYIYLQIIKKGSAGRLGYKIYYGKTLRLKNEQIYYYDDYIVISETGEYAMQIFSKDNPQKVLATGEFLVK